MNINRIIANELNIRESQVEKTVELLDDGNTVPFISRYRKEATGGLDDVTLRTLEERLTYLRGLEERKAEVLRLIDEQGALTDELAIQIEEAEVLQRVEDLYKPFKKKKSTRASMARELGLSPLADFIFAQENTPEEIWSYAKEFALAGGTDESEKFALAGGTDNSEKFAPAGGTDDSEEAKKQKKQSLAHEAIEQKKQILALEATEQREQSLAHEATEQKKQVLALEATEQKKQILAPETTDKKKQILTPDDAIAGAKDIIAEMISDDPDINDMIRKKTMASGVIESEATDPEESTVYDMYYGSSEKISKIPNHRILAINRGEKEKKLKVKVSCDKDVMEELIAKRVIRRKSRCEEILRDVVADAYKRLVAPSVEREMRKMLTERAEAEAVKVFAKNTEKLLMVPPVSGARIISIDPGYRTGCKVAVLDETGKLKAHTTVFPTKPKCQVAETESVLKKLADKYEVNTIVIGNGTASRETEEVVATFLRKAGGGIRYTIVNEAGASVYSASKLAAAEYPDLDVTVRGAISLGRRLQDPLAELVKIPIKSIGVGQYQHDINQGLLEKALDNVVEDCVNRVGVELNTASASLLERVAGVNKTIAKNIVSYREGNGKFRSRRELLKVPRLGEKAFEQCAGFIRIAGADNPLDNTAVHPESYEFAEVLVERLGMSIADSADGTAATEKAVINEIAAEYNVGIPTLNDILEELKKPGRDPREDAPPVVFRNDVRSFEDLEPGMELEGTVRNVVDFGAFVDIGVKNDGLVHISQLSDRYVKNPMEVVSVGDTVKVRILEIDEKRQRVSLTMRR